MGTVHPSAAWRRSENEGQNQKFPALWVVASCLGSGARIVGVAQDISRSGLSMVMPQRPTAVHHDVTVRDRDLSVELWVRVVDWHAADDGMYVWHVHVTTADDLWSGIVDRIND